MLKKGVLAGLKRGWRSYLWVLKILLPISFLTACLAWSGLIGKVLFLFQPVMGPLRLPAEAALPLLIGLTGGFYGGLAAMTALPFSQAQLTLMAIFMLMAHNLIQEGLIQAKSGLKPLKSIVFRITAALIAVYVSARLMGAPPAESLAGAAAGGAGPGFWEMTAAWAGETAVLSLKILVIVVSLSVLMETIRSMGWTKPVLKPFGPVLFLLGLSRRTGLLWLTAALFGLVYGAALIVEEAGRGELSPEELEDLQLSIGLNHSMIEDSLIFVALGCGLGWILLPRLVMAALAVRLLRLGRRVRRRAGLFHPEMKS